VNIFNARLAVLVRANQARVARRRVSAQAASSETHTIDEHESRGWQNRYMSHNMPYFHLHSRYIAFGRSKSGTGGGIVIVTPGTSRHGHDVPSSADPLDKIGVSEPVLEMHQKRSVQFR
jgi:hypothetical protein